MHFINYFFIINFLLLLNSFNSSCFQNVSNNELIDDDNNNGLKLNECENNNLITKLISLHEEGRGLNVSYNVVHINQTFEILDQLFSLPRRLFAPNPKILVQFTEFLDDAGFDLPDDCYNSLVRIAMEIRKGSVWAFKCM